VNFEQQLQSKLIPVEEAVLKLPDHSYLFCYGPGEPYGMLSRLQLLKGKRSDIIFCDSLHLHPYDFYTDGEMRGVVDCESVFMSHFLREAQKLGRISFVPNHLGKGYRDKLYYLAHGGTRKKVYAAMVSPMDRHGYFSTGPVGMSNRQFIEQADLVILEINGNMPRTFGNTYIHVSECDYAYMGSGKMFYLPEREPEEIDLAIGSHVAGLVEDESTLQLGIGTIPGAVARQLKDRKDLGVHTEMLGDALVDLYREGVITNAKKTLYKDKMVTAFSSGSRKVYDFLDDNPCVLHLDVYHVNDPSVIRRNRKMVSVNTTLQCDLMGQCASEAVGTLQLSGTGGQTETAQGAKMSEGGKSIIALHSTAMVANADGVRERKSTIVTTHPEGTVISLMRADTDYVVTEYGIAALRGASLSDRAKALISIAHPDYRQQLAKEARDLYLMV